MFNNHFLRIVSQGTIGITFLTAFSVIFAKASFAQQTQPIFQPSQPTNLPSQPVFQPTLPAVPPSSPPLPAPTSAQIDTNYTLGGGDRIRVNVFEVPEYTGEYTIPPGGAINLPLIGSVSVQGLTPEQAADEISRKYSRFLKRPLISVNLLAPRPINVTVAGEVTRPGAYALSLQGGAGDNPGVQYPTVLAALTTAQGVTQAADISKVQLRRKIGRNSEQIVNLDLREYLQTGRLPQDITLDLSENSKASVFKALRQNFDIFAKTQL